MHYDEDSAMTALDPWYHEHILCPYVCILR